MYPPQQPTKCGSKTSKPSRNFLKQLTEKMRLGDAGKSLFRMCLFLAAAPRTKGKRRQRRATLEPNSAVCSGRRANRYRMRCDQGAVGVLRPQFDPNIGPRPLAQGSRLPRSKSHVEPVPRLLRERLGALRRRACGRSQSRRPKLVPPKAAEAGPKSVLRFAKPLSPCCCSKVPSKLRRSRGSSETSRL